MADVDKINRGRATLLKGGLAVAGIWLAWRIVTLGMAEQAQQELHDPRTALEWRATQPGALIELGLRESGVDSPQALSVLHQAILANPTDGRAYAALGRLLEKRGEAARAREAMEAASRLSPQRSDVQMEVAAFWMRQNAVARALRHWNIVLKNRPDLHSQLFPALVKLAGEPAYRAAFLPLLKEAMPWWPAFFIYAAGNASDADTVRALFSLQAGGPNAATPEMLRAYLQRLQKDGAWLESWFAWLNSLPKGSVGKLGYLYNGSFEQPISNTGFDWIYRNDPAVTLETAATYDTSGERALRVSFRGVRSRFQNLYQYLMLPPGKFNLQGRVRPDDLQASQGMQWALYCVGSNEPIAVSDHFRGSGQWSRFRTTFTVPDANCGVQMLRLELAGTIGLDFDADGTIWFDNLGIEQAR